MPSSLAKKILNRLRAFFQPSGQRVAELEKCITGLHHAVKTSFDTLHDEIHRLHTLTTGRHEAQLHLLNHEIYTLKHRLYHAAQPLPEAAFNGQFSKHMIFEELCNTFPFDAFVETGAYLGHTSAFLARRGKPVHTVEINKNFHPQAQAYLAATPQVRLEQGDSVSFLRRLLQNTLPKSDLVFIYLDAHWYDHLPIREEVTLIATHHPRAVVMIDDFKVEDDAGYGFDSYDKGQEITLAFLKEEMKTQAWQVFFPAMSSQHDHITNDILAPRGTLVLACDPEVIEKLRGMTSLRAWQLRR